MMKIFLLFYMCDFAVGLTHYYKTTVFFYIYLTITVSQIEQDIGRKSSFSHSPLAFDPPVKAVPPSEHRHPVWYGKTRMAWPPDGEKI